MDDGFYCVVCEAWQSPGDNHPSTCGDKTKERRRFELRATAPDGAATICTTVETCARHDRVFTRNALARELGDLVRAAKTAAREWADDGNP